MALKIVLADDRHDFRQNFRQLLVSLPDARLTAETDNSSELESLAQMVKPDVIVVNLAMPGAWGSNLITRLCEHLGSSRVIAIARQDDEAYILDLLRNGVYGFLPISAEASELMVAIRYVGQGVRYVSPVSADRLISLLIEKTTYFFTEPYQKLTKREREVFHLTAEGFSGPEIAARLTISPRTVELHRSNLMRKLGLNNQRDLIRYAVQSGALPLDEGNRSH